VPAFVGSFERNPARCLEGFFERSGIDFVSFAQAGEGTWELGVIFIYFLSLCCWPTDTPHILSSPKSIVLSQVMLLSYNWVFL
jgi:hypothetical protein